MSIAAVLAVLRLNRPGLTPGEQHSLTLLAIHFNENHGAAWPSVRLLAHESRRSRRGVQIILVKLKEKSLIVPTSLGARRAVNYSLAIDGFDCETISQSERLQPGLTAKPFRQGGANNDAVRAKPLRPEINRKTDERKSALRARSLSSDQKPRTKTAESPQPGHHVTVTAESPSPTGSDGSAAPPIPPDLNAA